MESYRQSALWSEFPDDSPPFVRIDRARAKTKEPSHAFSLPLWPEESIFQPAEPSEETSCLVQANPESIDSIGPAGPTTSDIADSSESTTGPSFRGANLQVQFPVVVASQNHRAESREAGPDLIPIPKPLSRHSRSPAPMVTERKVSIAPDSEISNEGAMESIADLVRELMEQGGAASMKIRPFVTAFPPSEQWGEPWPTISQDLVSSLGAFAPSASGYATVLSEVLAGRRRARVEGIWESGSRGNVVLSRGLATSDWQLVEVNSDAPPVIGLS